MLTTSQVDPHRSRLRGLLAVLTTAMVVGSGLTLFAEPAAADSNGTTERFESPEGVAWTVPKGVYELDVVVAGAGGGDIDSSDYGVRVRGGNGAEVKGTIRVTPGDVFTFYGSTAGGRGEKHAPGDAGVGYTNGGKGHHARGNVSGSYQNQTAGSSGGGSSAILDSSGEPLVVAGAGGGAGGFGGNGCSRYGGAGGNAGEAADNGHGGQLAPSASCYDIGDDQLSDGGAGGVRSGGSGGLGEEAWPLTAGGGGGGGGAGYLGGNGGGGSKATNTIRASGGGGGAGSSFVREDLAWEITSARSSELDGYVSITYAPVEFVTTTTVTSAPFDNPYVGDSTTLTATVAHDVTYPALPPTGEIRWEEYDEQGEFLRIFGTSSLTPDEGTVSTATVNWGTSSREVAYFKAVYVPSTDGEVEFLPSEGTIDVLERTRTTLAGPTEHPSYIPSESYELRASVISDFSEIAVTVGQVALYRNGTEVARAPLDDAGQATFEHTVTTPMGSEDFTVEYVGADLYDSSSSSEVSVANRYSGNTAVLEIEQDDIEFGDETTVTVSLTPDRPITIEPEGTVSLYIDNEEVDAQQPDENRRVEFTFNAEKLGAAAVHAIYWRPDNSPEAVWSGARSNTVQLDVDRTTTQTDLSIVQDQVRYGESVFVDVDVSAARSSAPVTDGEVTLSIGGEEVETKEVGEDGTAVFEVTADAIGEHQVTASYQGTEGYGASSAEGAFEVLPIRSTVELLIDEPDIVFGETLPVSALVGQAGPGTAPLGGSVQFRVDGEDWGEPVGLDDDTSSASLEFEGLAVGDHAVQAVYSGSAARDGVESTVIDIEVAQVASTVELTADAAVVAIGEPFAVRAAVGTTSAGTAPVDGTMRFTVDGEDWGDPVEVEDGVATVGITGLDIGSYTVGAVYSGNADNTRTGATSNEVTAGVTAADARVELTIDADSGGDGASHFGQPVDMTAALTFTAGEAPLAGRFEFFAVSDNGADLSLGTVPALKVSMFRTGEVTLTVDGLPVGTHDVYVVFDGSTSINPAKSARVTHQVMPAGAQVRLTILPEASEVGDDITVTADVASALPSAHQPTGTVQFFVDDEIWGEPVELDAGIAPVTITGLPVGTLDVQARYAGDDGYHPADSDVVRHVVSEQNDDSNSDNRAGADGANPAKEDSLPATGAEANAHAMLIGILLLAVGACAVAIAARRRTRAAQAARDV